MLESMLVKAFSQVGFQLTQQDFIYRIAKSGSLSKETARKIIASAQFCPIITETRVGGLLEFVVVPFRWPERFNKIEVPKEKVNEEQLWPVIESRPQFTGWNHPVIVQGNTLFKTAQEAKKFLMPQCILMDSNVLDFLDNAAESGQLLDLGCGIGVNSLPFLQKKWQVTAIDNLSEVLEIYRKTITSEGFEKEISFICEDVTKIELENRKFDVILAVDVFLYVPPKELRALMQKIHHALVPNGTFIGTFHFKLEERPEYNQFFEQTGAHFYQGAHLAPAILESTGFKIDDCKMRLDKEDLSPNIVQFIAKKLA